MSGKPKKLKNLTDADYWKIIQQFYVAKHKSGTKKLDDVVDKKYLTNSGNTLRKKTILENLSVEAKKNIVTAYNAVRFQMSSITNPTEINQQVANILLSTNNFLTNINNIFQGRIIQQLSSEEYKKKIVGKASEREQKIKEMDEQFEKEVRPLTTIDIDSNIQDLKRWLDLNVGFEESQSYQNILGRYTELKRFEQLSEEDKRDEPNRELYRRQIKKPKPKPKPQPEKEPEIPKGFKEDIFGNIVPIERKQISKNPNLLKGETYEQLIQRFQELIKQETEDPNEEGSILSARRIGEYLKRIQRAKTQIRARDARKANLEKMKKQLQSVKKSQDKKIEQASQQLASLLGQQEQKAEAREAKASEERKEISTAIQSINDIVRGDDRATEIKDVVFNTLRMKLDPDMDIKRDTTYKIKKPKKESKLSKENVNQLIREIPEEYRGTLAPTVRSLFSGNSLDANTIVSGIVGMGLAMSTGSPIAGRIGVGAFNFLRSSLGFNFNNIFQPPLPPPSEQLPPLPRPTIVSEKLKPIKERKTFKQSAQDVSEFLNVVGQVDDDEDLDLDLGSITDIPITQYESEVLRLERIKGESDITYVSRLEELLNLAQQNNDMETASRIKNLIANLEEFVNPFQDTGMRMRMREGKHGETDFSQIPVSDSSELPDYEDDEGIKNTNIMRDVVSMLTNFFSRTYDIAVSQALLRRTINYVTRLPMTAIPLLYSITKGKSGRDIDYALMTAGVALSGDMESDRKFDDMPLDAPIPEQKASPSVTGKRGFQIPRLVRPTLEDANQGVTAGAVGGALGGMLSGGASGGIAGIVPGGMAGAIGGSVSASALRSYFNQRGEQVSDSKIQMLAALPTAMLGAYLGYQGTGKEITSGAVGGVTETKINVDADVLKSTQAQESQDIGKNKQWAPKTIAPTPSILDKPPQEMYAEDLEATLFDYVAPTSEGANGTVFTNQLKRNQYMNEQLRYYKSGVFVPAKLWEQMNTPENMTKEKLDRLAFGQKPIIKIPDMEFIPASNETTWDTVADKQYPNNEPFGIEFLDPYSSYSDVTNYWATNAQSKLYTINM